MPRLSGIAILLLAATYAFADDTPKPDDEGFTPIFNGKDMTGWEGKPGWWKVEDGALTAESTPEKPCKKHNYLMWRGGSAPGDFELKLTYRIIGEGGNSGIQFRSRELPNWDIAGYQADIESGDTWTGCLFEVTGRNGGVAMRGTKTVSDPDGKQHVTKIGDSKELMKKVRKNDWNDYHIIAKGNTITLKINGVVMTQAVDNAVNRAKPGGMIALQMHPGPPMKIQFKDIRIKKD